MKKIKAGEQLLRPSEGKELGLSDELWGLVQSSLTHEVEERPPVSAFLDFLEKATPNISVLRELVEFDVNSEDDIKKLRHMFEYEDNVLLGMREGETLMVIEIFDRVKPVAQHLFTPLDRFSLCLVTAPQLLIERLHTPQPVPPWTSASLCQAWAPAEELLDPLQQTC